MLVETYPQQTHNCNRCQRCFHQVLTQGGEHLSNQDILVLYFYINFLKSVEFVFHLEVVGYDV